MKNEKAVGLNDIFVEVRTCSWRGRAYWL